MKPAAKVAIVIGGYVGAVLVAAAVVATYVAFTSGPDRQTYAAMYDFGDSLLFLAVFGVAAVLPTGAALFFLRPYPAFWWVISSLALVTAASGAAALLVNALARNAVGGAPLQAWAGIGMLRIFLVPLFGPVFLVAGIFAPRRSSRIALWLACAMELAVFGAIAAVLFRSQP